MTNDRLREAARVLRERAEAAAFLSHEGWSTDGHQVISGSAGWCLVAVTSDESADDRTSRFIATMHPGVALALADWLDSIATRWIGPGGEPIYRDTYDGDVVGFDESHDSDANRIADLILGSAS